MAQFLSSFKAISVPAIRCNGCNRRQETIQSSVSKLGLYLWNSFEPFQLFKRQQCLTQPVFGPYQSPFTSLRRTVEWRRQLAEEVAEGMYSVASMDTPNPQFHEQNSWTFGIVRLPHDITGFLDFQLVFEVYLYRLVYRVSRFVSNFVILLYAAGSIKVALGIGIGQQEAIVWFTLPQIIALFGMPKCPIPYCQFPTFIESAI